MRSLYCALGTMVVVLTACSTQPSDVRVSHEKANGDKSALEDATKASPQAFMERLTRYSSSTYASIESLEQFIDLADFIAVGRLQGVERGRGIVSARGCDSEEWEGEGECPGNANALLFSGQVNLAFETEELVKGRLQGNRKQFYVERPWPLDALEGELDELRDTAPVGVRVLVVGTKVDTEKAFAESAQLEQEGRVPPGLTRNNLVGAAPIGIGFESEDGRLVVPALGDTVLQKYIGPSGAQSFDEVVSFVSKYVSETE